MKGLTVASILCSCLAVAGFSRALAQWLITTAPGEVSGPLSAQPFIIEAFSLRPTPPCDTVALGCGCCYWALGTESGSDSFNLYRMDDLRNLGLGYDFRCVQSGIIMNFTQCCEPGPLAPGQVVGFLVQGVNLSGVSILGRDSLGNPIPAAASCP